MKQRVFWEFLALLMLCLALTLASCKTAAPTDGVSTEIALPSEIASATEAAQTEAETNKTNEVHTDANGDKIILPTFDYDGREHINARDFGFKGDGKTPNDDVMKEYIKYYASTPLYFSMGVYAFEETIAFDDRMYLYLDPKAELKCIAKEPLDYFITLRAGVNTWGDTMHDYALQSFIRGGVINANYCAKTALGLHGGHHTNFESFEICNVLETGIKTAMNSFKDGCFFFDNLLIYNDKGLRQTVGIEDYSYDSMFYDIIILNFETGIRGGGTYFKDVSCWFNSAGKNLVTTSVYAEVTGGNPIFDHPMVDTYRTGFQLSGKACISVNNMTWITNGSFYSSEMQQTSRMCLFSAEDDNCRIMLNGLYIPASKTLDFSNIPLPSSSFLNVRYPAGYDPEASGVTNFRDDSKATRELLEFYEKYGDKLKDLLEE